jgi:transposase
LKTVIVQAALAASRKRDSHLKAQFLRLRSRRGPEKAILAVAASMMVAVYHMLRDGVEYQDLGGDHFDRRDRAKIAHRLIRRLEELGLEVKVQPAAA